MVRFLKNDVVMGRAAVKSPCLFMFILLLCSCSPRIIKEIQHETLTEYKDRIEWRDTTLYVPIPLGTGEVITHLGDTARTETSVAEAEAWVDGSGKLHLELTNKDGTIPYTTKIPSRDIWTSVTNSNVETLTRVEYRDKPLSAWKSFQIGAFWWLCAIVLALVLWLFRKPLMSLIRLVIP